MRDLVRLSEEELQEITASQRLKMFVAVGISMACGIISLQGMAVLFTDAKVVPLPGMQHLYGQIAWAVALFVLLLAVTLLLRGVIKRRLQWAIALSLLIHFLLCLSMTTVEFRGPRSTPVQAADRSDIPRDEFSLPDYAADKSMSADAPWEKPVETVTPESEVELERAAIDSTQTQIFRTEQTEPVQPLQEEVPAPVQPVPTPEQKETVELIAEAKVEMSRSAESAASDEQSVEQPEIATEASHQADLEPQQVAEKLSSEIPSQNSLDTQSVKTEIFLTPAELAASRSEAVPSPEQTTTVQAHRTLTESQAISAPAESVELSTTRAPAASVMEKSVNAARQNSTAPSAANLDATAMSGPNVRNNAAPLSRVSPQRSTSNEQVDEMEPAAGGVVQIQRNAVSDMPANSDSSGEAEIVDVAAPGQAGIKAIRESAAAGAKGRESAATLARAKQGSAEPGSAAPVSPTAGSASSMASVMSKTGTIRGEKTERNVGGDSAPEPGDTGQSLAGIARSNKSAATAVGTEAEPGGGTVAATNAASPRTSPGSNPGEASSDGSSLIVGPAKSIVGRRSTGLPSSVVGTTNGTGSGPPSSASSSPSSVEPSGSPNRAAISGLLAGAGRDPGGMAAPEGVSGADTAGSFGRKRGAEMSLPDGAADAERSGALVMAGPQSAASTSAASGAGAVSGPRIASVPRRSASLPGQAGGSGAPAPGLASQARPGRSVPQPARGGASAAKPALASAESLAGLVKRSAPGLGSSPEARIPESLSMRASDARQEAARTLGGSEASEDAVERGLAWLERNQHGDGHWSIHDFPGDEVPNLAQGNFQSNTAATGLALLAYLGAGYTHQSGKYQVVVSRGMKWLLDRQKRDGDLFADETEFVWFYSHGIASIAVCEAYGLTRDPILRDPAQRALNFIVVSQHPVFGGWRYRPKFESDTSVSGWQVMALKSGEMAGLDVPKQTYQRVGKWLDSVQSSKSTGQYSYHPSQEASPAMTAEALLMRQYLGAGRSDPQLIAGANFLRTRLPDSGQRDSYYWYYATQVMFHMQGEYWEEWNSSLRDTLVTTQSGEGTFSGSWDPARPTTEKWATAGGRHYLTTVNLLMLEVYYRHLPLYLELEK